MSRTGLWYANNEVVTGANLNQRSHHVWGPHIVGIFSQEKWWLHQQTLSFKQQTWCKASKTTEIANEHGKKMIPKYVNNQISGMSSANI